MILLIVWNIDRIGRSIRDLIQLINQFKVHEVDFVSRNDNIYSAL
ncbi:MAG: recombinase family protein [Sedimenticola sp.]